MIKNYFKTAWRNLLKNKGLSFINIFGLAVGMTFAILVGMWIQFETSFDGFHANGDRIAVVKKNTFFNNEKNTQTGIVLPLYDELKDKYPEVKRISRKDWGGSHSLMVGNNKFKKNGTYVDPDFLKMFSFPLVKGDVETALKDPNSLIVTESLATTLFGKDDPIGKIVRIDNKFDIQVTAVAKDPPKNSSLNFEFLAPFEFKIQNFEWIKNAKTQWSNNFLMNLVEIKEGVSMEAFSRKIGPIMVQKDKEKNKNQTLFLQPMSQWHLYDEYKNWANVGGKIDYVRLFGIIGIFVLLIACINFMNLSTARSEKRAKEVGIRKAVGSQRSQLIIQFLSESVLTTFIAFILSIFLMWMVLPFLKDLGFENIVIDFSSLSLVFFILAVCIVTGLIAGSYPALYLSSFRPVKVLKGVLNQGKGAIIFRRALVVSQFAISVGLIISTVIVFQQIRHAKNRSIGYDPDNLISIGASTDLAKNYEVLKQELLNTGHIESVAKASSPMTSVYNSWSGFSWEGYDPNVTNIMDIVMTEWDYDKAVGLKFKAGRSFSRDFLTDSTAVILNEAAIKMIGFKDPVGKTIKLDSTRLTIIGVVENVVMKNPFQPVAATAILFDKENVSNIFLRLKSTASLEKSLAAIKPIIEKYNPSLPFEYSFVDEEFQKKFTTENQVAKLAGIFAGLAIFISCLGLFGLAAFMAERRIKEIGIRKVLGASVTNLWLLLSKEFVLLVMIACLIASPLAFWLMKDWLQKYDYRIDISWWVFIIAGVLALVIALLTVSTQAIKAAISNPVKSLRTE
jgi:ABC-type antimicrobial peptide transport system permease subunit